MLIAIGIVVGLYLLGLIGVAWISVHPMRIPLFCSPGGFGASQENLTLTTSDGLSLAAWWVEAPEAKATVVLAHGYLMNRSELAPLAYALYRQGISTLSFDFRAHGRSGGRTTTFGLRERRDVRAAIEEARRRAPNRPLFVLGSSMGAAAAAHALAEDRAGVEGLIFDSGFSRLAEASVGWWRFVVGPFLTPFLVPASLMGAAMTRVNPYRVDVAEALRSLGDLPILILHGTKDLLVPQDQVERNRAACTDVSCVWFEGCDHTEGRWVRPEQYLAAVGGFLASPRSVVVN